MSYTRPILERYTKQGRYLPAVGFARPTAKDTLALVDPGGQRLGVDESRMCATFVLTTEAVDRVGDIVVASGISLESFAKNPIAPYAHQAALAFPIGKWEDPEGRCTVRIEPGRALGTLYFSQTYDQAAVAFALVCEGILRCVSIGFNPLMRPVPRDEDGPGAQGLQVGYVYPKIDLLECSLVMVPAQAEATLLHGHLSRGKIGGVAIAKEFRQQLEPFAEAKTATLFTGESSMSKKWNKGRKAGEVMPGEQPQPKRGESLQKGFNVPESFKKRANRKDALAEGSGPAGGYSTPEAGPEAALHQEPHQSRVKAIIGVMHRHKGNAQAEGPHDAFYHPEKGLVHHHHSPQDAPDHLARVQSDLAGIEGLQVTQHHEKPAEDGYSKIYSLTDNPQEPGNDPETGDHPQEVTPQRREAAAPDEDAAVDHRQVQKAIIGVMHRHKDQANPEGPHDAYYHEEHAHAFHHHAETDDLAHLKAVKDDLHAIEGLQHVSQHHDASKVQAAGFVKIYSSVPMEGDHPAEVTPEYSGTHKGSALQECVSKKIPKLLAEGYPQDQAEAIAFSMCGEKAMKDLIKRADQAEHRFGAYPIHLPRGMNYKDMLDRVMGKAADDEPSESPEEEAGEAEEPGGEELPLGAECLQALVEHLEAKAHLIENEPVREFYERILEEAQEIATEEYPGLDLGGHEEEEGEDADSETASREQADADLAEYRKPPPRSAQARRTKEATDPAEMPDEERDEDGSDPLAMIKEVADHLHEHGDMDEGKPLTKKHKAAHRYHARRMDSLAGQMKFSGSFEQPVPPGDDGAEMLHERDFESMARKGLQDALSPLEDSFYKLTGRKMNGKH